MKKTLLSLFALVAGITHQAQANHDIGGSLTYANVAPNLFIVGYQHYNWAGLVMQPQGFNLKVDALGCTSGRTVPMTFQQQVLGGVAPTLGGVMPYRISMLTTAVNLSPAEAACSEVIFSLNSGRIGQSSANLIGDAGIQIYTESTLKPTLAPYNQSPIFYTNNEPAVVTSAFQPTTLSIAAFDPDGDSLVYRMVSPLIAHNQPITNYKAFSPTTFPNPNPQLPFSNPTNPQFGVLNGAANYSPQWPLPSYSPNWASMQPFVPAYKNFILDSLNGSFSFTPQVYDSAGINTYLVAFQVDEYRKINGTFTRIGSIRRETAIFVGTGGSNNNPRLSNFRTNVATNPQDTFFTINPGTNFVLQADGFDTNSSDSIYLASNASEFPGATFSISSGNRQNATFSWTPTAADVRARPYYLRIWVKDNAKPVAGKYVQTLEIHIRNSSVMGIKSAIASGNFYAFPNPFSQEVSFRLPEKNKAKEVIIYNVLGQQIDRILVNENAGLRWEKAASFPAGSYVAKLISEDKTVQTVKFTKVQ